jgi:hypothetical protein
MGWPPSRYTANLAFHDAQVEQDLETLRAQAVDVVRLCGAGAVEVSVNIELRDEVAGSVPTRLRAVTGDVEPRQSGNL